jgi:hypothetical protein
MLNHENIDNYQLSNRLLLVDVEEFSVNDNNKVLVNDEPVLFDDDIEKVLVNDYESDVEEGLDDGVLEEESSNFESFSGKYDLYFPNFTSLMIFIWITKHMICK